jgi:hypothetical protein
MAGAAITCGTAEIELAASTGGTGDGGDASGAEGTVATDGEVAPPPGVAEIKVAPAPEVAEIKVPPRGEGAADSELPFDMKLAFDAETSALSSVRMAHSF